LVFGLLAFVLLIPNAGWKGILAGILTGLPVLAFAKSMPVKTRTGAFAYMDILGFQEFMNRAEKDRLERMGDKNLFSKFLPYAIALDVTENWARAFEGIYQEPPNWYVSPVGFRTFSPYAFTHSLNSVTSNLGSAMFSAPRSSGGGGGGLGGGGSSGGGFGKMHCKHGVFPGIRVVACPYIPRMAPWKRGIPFARCVVTMTG
jgi:uncharacterized membrane protein YgcG